MSAAPQYMCFTRKGKSVTGTRTSLTRHRSQPVLAGAVCLIAVFSRALRATRPRGGAKGKAELPVLHLPEERDGKSKECSSRKKRERRRVAEAVESSGEAFRADASRKSERPPSPESIQTKMSYSKTRSFSPFKHGRVCLHGRRSSTHTHPDSWGSGRRRHLRKSP